MSLFLAVSPRKECKTCARAALPSMHECCFPYGSSCLISTSPGSGMHVQSVQNEPPLAVQPVNHTYSFFDFQDSIPDTVTFQPCVMVPGGTGCDCVDLKCAVDESARSKSIELATTHPVHDDVVYDVRNNETTQCSAPKGYVTKGRNSIAVGVACAHPTKRMPLRRRFPSSLV